MPWKVNVFMLIDVEEPPIYQDKAEAQQEADQIMFMQPGEMLASVVECDEDGIEV